MVFGENQTDREAIKLLIQAIIPPEQNVKFKCLRTPIILSRDAKERKREGMLHQIALLVRGHQKDTKVSSVFCVVHRDCDDVEPNHISHEREIEEGITKHGVLNVVAATPAWEIETWWMLFPKALTKVRPCWNSINYGKQQVGKIRNSKEELRRMLRPNDRSSKCSDYKETDSILIAEELLRDRSRIDNINAVSESFQSFRSKILGVIA